MRRGIFYRILNDVVSYEPYFTQKVDACGRQSISPEQKLTVVFQMLAYGCSADSTDEYYRLGESTALECLRKFCSVIEAVYGQWYLRSPNLTDLYRLLHKATHRGFPSMLGNLDCMHWELKNCPTAWACHYKHKPTVVLEAMALSDTWIWHAFFGVARSNNDINVIARSPLLNDVVNGVSPHIQYVVNGNEYNLDYYLADGIYPR
ncbi:PREDICTED: uncharacterized protein LOC103336966 [Prunus mume]|uniref:Uncharacterized protein LOC103336966 n=1 Tax=Prunus mume TaxID=102107 RepID=A0ABM1LUF0_PRUMU|nr:PREDICTED: uncharacterized protein LOC103336966 [Prunus mume]